MHAPEALSRARSVHSAHEVEEHPAPHAGRGADYPSRTRVLTIDPGGIARRPLHRGAVRRCRLSISPTAAASGSLEVVPITAYLAQQDDPRPLGLLAGARLGFRAGIFGAVVWLFASAAVNVMVAPLQQSAADLMLRNATDIPPDVRTWLESVGNSASMPMRMVFGFFFQLFVAAPFAVARRPDGRGAICSPESAARGAVKYPPWPRRNRLLTLRTCFRRIAPSPLERVPRATPTLTTKAFMRTRRKRSGSLLGLPLRPSSSGSRRGRRCSSGSRRTRSGSSAARSTRSVNCVDRHVRGPRAQQGGAHLGRRAGRPPHADLLRSLSPGQPVRQRPEVARRASAAIASRSTCR